MKSINQMKTMKTNTELHLSYRTL